jgi:hypothetical protein
MWVLLYIVLSGDPPNPNRFPVVKFADELFASEQECRDSFANSSYYKQDGELIGICVGGAMMLSPKQLKEMVDRPKK